MKKVHLLIATLLLLALCRASAQVVKVPATPDRWDTIKVNRDDTTSINLAPGIYKGKACLVLQSGMIVLKGVDLRDGIIEADLSFPQQRSFPGFAVRMKDMDNFESFYLRPHQSGNPDATQYTPEFNGQTGFQLYYGEGYDGAYAFRFDDWHHFKIELHGLQAEFYIDGTPVIRVKELLTGWKAGKIAIGTDGARLRIANVQYTIMGAAAPGPVPVPASGTGGVVTRWQVSNLVHQRLFEKALRLTPEIKKKLIWTARTTEPSGMMNLARFGGVPTDTGRTMVARLLVESARDQVKALPFGFSDYVRVYLNDTILYYGADKQYSRDYRFLGTIGYFDRLFLPLKKGTNELWLVVSEDFGGWGVKAKFENMEGISFK
ncbi:MAG TPA: hypothetical protein VK668_04360 [Mucilaginibacter sp.]|nr:hypothetical protein [Mucilaginibacter sp.]